MVDVILKEATNQSLSSSINNHHPTSSNSKLEEEVDLISTKDEKGMTPAHLAAYNGYTRFIILKNQYQ